MASNYGLYAYGVVDRGPETSVIMGIDKLHTVFPVQSKESCVMVSKIDIDLFQSQVTSQLSALTANVEAAQHGAGAILQVHEDVVDALMKHTTIVPFQFGTILNDETAVHKMLQENGAHFKNLLAKFAGRAEWGMKVYADQQEFIDYVVHFEPEFKKMAAQREGLSRGIAYLLGRKMEEELKNNALTRLAEVCELIFLKLGNAAYEGRLHKTLPQKLTGKKKEMILNTAYLVEKEKGTTFCQQGERLMERYSSMGLDLEVSGPWPPYSFIA